MCVLYMYSILGIWQTEEIQKGSCQYGEVPCPMLGGTGDISSGEIKLWGRAKVRIPYLHISEKRASRKGIQHVL